MSHDDRALEFHSDSPPGKLTIQPSKPCRTEEELALAYIPGVAAPCKAIAKDPEAIDRYTSRANLIALVTNGTRVLGLGDLGPRAAKPSLEGKAVLFKRFADVDAHDLELDTRDVDEFVRCVEVLSTGYGGVHLEDIKNPDCFLIEQALRARLKIPVFQDDQHGSAIVAVAALVNALRVQEKSLDQVRVVCLGAGASGLAVAALLVAVGVARENLVLCDTGGVLHTGRAGEVNVAKAGWLKDTPHRSFDEAIVDADVFIGTAGPDLLSAEQLSFMADRPVVLALATPAPEIDPTLARATRDDLVLVTSLSSEPNHCANELVFPGFFRGALDVGATTVHPDMVRAAVQALAALAREPVPEEVSRAYEGQRFEFGPDYVLPKPLDPRVLTAVAPAVARAAIEAGVARREVEDWFNYRSQLEKRFGLRLPLLKQVKLAARADPKTIVFPEGESPLVLGAVRRILEEGFAKPVLLGEEARVRAAMSKQGLAGEITVVDPTTDPRRHDYAEVLFSLRGRRGGSRLGARDEVKMSNTFASLMLREGHADAMISGAEHSFSETARPAFQIIGMRHGACRVAGIHMVAVGGKMYFFADTSVNICPTSEQLADIALSAARLAEAFRVRPRVAMLSYSSFGSVVHRDVDRVRQATRLLRERDPELVVEGEIAPDVALSPETVEEHFPQSLIKGDANVLIFPDLSSGNLAYKAVEQLADAKVVGPLLVGFSKPVCILPQGSTIENVVSMAAIMAIAAIDPRTLGAAPETSDLTIGA